MPTNLDEPNIDDINLLPIIVEERLNGSNKFFFSLYESIWLNRYNEYIIHQGNAESIKRSCFRVKKDKDRFINLYLNEPKSVKTDIKDILDKHSLTFCPFCGEAGRPNTLDHFLPKGKYPEYSILSKNLVPACDACQGDNAKGEKVLNFNSKKIFLHPYYDIPKNIPILKIKIFPPYDKGYKFKLYVNKSINDLKLKKLCRRHINALNINSRFREFYSKEYLRKKILIKDFIEQFKLMKGSPLTLEEVKNIVENLYKKEKDVSVNYWDAVIYKGFLDNDDLLNYLLNS